MKLTLIRHSKTKIDPDTAISQWGLSEDGIELAKELSNREVIKNIDLFYSSLQTKALETAVYLAKPHGTPIKTDADLTEVSSFTKKFFGGEQYEQNVKDFYSGEIDRIADGETSQEALDRFNKTIGQIIDSEKVNNIGIVAHGNVLAFFTSQYSDDSPLTLHNMIKMPDVAVLDWETKKFELYWSQDE